MEGKESIIIKKTQKTVISLLQDQLFTAIEQYYCYQVIKLILEITFSEDFLKCQNHMSTFIFSCI